MKTYKVIFVYNGKRMHNLVKAKSFIQAKDFFFNEWGFDAYIYDILEVK